MLSQVSQTTVPTTSAIIPPTRTVLVGVGMDQRAAAPRRRIIPMAWQMRGVGMHHRLPGEGRARPNRR
jgi:hypothetical protein